MSAQEWKSFFDASQARGAGNDPNVGDIVAPTSKASGDAMSVSALVAQIKSSLEGTFPGRVTIAGEISNLKRHTSGHMYFRLKDASAAIDATMFRSYASRMKFEPTDGLEVIAEGHVDVYEVRGQLQIRVERMTPKGAGELELAFRQLCEKLRAEGLFAAEAKKPIPRFPRAIAVVTSQTGAAIRDIGRTLCRRWPAARVYLVATLVQGEGAGRQIAQAIKLLDANASQYEIDTIIVARGGGSLEDLWAFNEEVVARAIYSARTPIISGVGHEVDVTVADMVADVRAATPTAAAELAVPQAEEIGRYVGTLQNRLNRTVTESMLSARTNLQGLLRSAVFRDPLGPIRTQMQHVDELSHRLAGALHNRLILPRRGLEQAANRLASLHPASLRERAAAKLAQTISRLAWALGGKSKRAGDALATMAVRLVAANPKHRIRLAGQKIHALARQLDAMSYRSVLARGFSVARKNDGTIIRSKKDVAPGQLIRTELSDGKIDSRVIQADGKIRKTGKSVNTQVKTTLFDLDEDK